MFPTSIRVVLASLVFCAMGASAAPGLSMAITGPSTADGVEKLHLTVQISNTGDIPMKLLKSPTSPLSTMPADTFKITDLRGSKPTFIGIKAKYSHGYVVRADNETFFTVLAPGQSVAITHDLSKAYNFTDTGEGLYYFEANNLFYYADPTSKVVRPIYAVADTHRASLFGTLAVARRSSHFGKRASFRNCTASQESDLTTAATNGDSYAADARTYLVTATTSNVRYTTWFGNATTDRYTTVLSHFTNIASHSFSSYTFDCSVCNDPAGTVAYVYAEDFGTVYLCDGFWEAPALGTDSKAGSLVHESSHFTINGGTHDHVYGQESAKSLAMTDPDMAIDNADNHEYFAENDPTLP